MGVRFVPPGVRMVRKIPNGYEDLLDPSIVYHIENVADYPERARLTSPARTRSLRRLPGGDMWIAGVRGGVNSMRHIRLKDDGSKDFDVETTGDADCGRQWGVNARFDWNFGNALKFQGNPTFLGAAASTDWLYPSPGIMTRNAFDQGLISASCRTVLDFDPRRKEKAYGVPMVDASDALTQALWLTMPMHSKAEISDDGVWTCTDGICYDEGTPKSVVAVEKNALVASHFTPGLTFNGGATLIDAVTGQTIDIRGAAWMIGDKPLWNVVHAPRSNGQPGRVDVFGTGVKDVWDWPFTSGHVIVVLHSGMDGVPDDRSALGTYVHLEQQVKGRLATGANSIKIRPIRGGQCSTPAKSTDWATIAVTVAAEDPPGERRPPGSRLEIQRAWTHGKYDEVVAKLRQHADL